jgi:hypothetical protein
VTCCLITWDGPCPTHGKWHACKRDDAHQGRHICSCTETSMIFLNEKPERERAPRIYQKAHGTVARRDQSWQRRDPSYYLPKYMKRKRGLL